MTLNQIKDPDAITRAIEEYDRVGQKAFLRKYGFGRAQKYLLKVGDRLYDSKAIVGAAHGYEYPEDGPLLASEFSGGDQTVARKLKELGFQVVRIQGDSAGSKQSIVVDLVRDGTGLIHVKPRHFLQYWKPKQVDFELAGSTTLTHTGSEQLKRAAPQDVIWIVTVRPKGELRLVGRMQVEEIIPAEEAEVRSPGDLYPASYHAFATPGTEQPYNELTLKDVAPQLRFNSPTSDRLTVSSNRVDGKQLQTIRELATESVAILERKWKGGHVAIEFENKIRRTGAGFGDPETNKRVEIAAVNAVTVEYQNRGWIVQSVEADKCGYDLICSRNEVEEHIEVKGIQGTVLSFIITAREVKQAVNNPFFKLCVVTLALSQTPELHTFGGQDLKVQFELEPMAFRATLMISK